MAASFISVSAVSVVVASTATSTFTDTFTFTDTASNDVAIIKLLPPTARPLVYSALKQQ